MASFGDSISHESEREFAELKRSRATMVRFGVAIAAFLGLLLFLVSTLSTYQAGEESITRVRRELLATQLAWTGPFVASQERYAGWLQRHGTGAEVEFFDHVSKILLRSGASYSAQFRDDSEPSVFSRTYFALHGGALRIVFLLVSSWRLWLVVVGGVMLWSFFRLRVHTGDDLLGITGNGRLFYSGARVDLSKISDSGAPDLLVPGLACPERETAAVVKSSELGRCLESFGALNETTAALAGIVMKRGDDPAYVADAEEEENLRRVFKGAPLGDQARLNLSVALELHRFYRCCISGGDELTVSEDPPDLIGHHAEPFDGAAYAEALRAALHRVLTPMMRADLARLSPYEIAVVVLGLESGKIMVHTKEGGKWIRRSRFPQLCARAFVHSIPEFGREFTFTARQHIRRAFVYGSRKSDFAPVRLPLDFAPESRAARQWVEVLMAVPHQLATIADEAELLALVTEGHQRWSESFFAQSDGHSGELLSGAYGTHGNLLLMPLRSVLALLRKAVESSARARIETLMASVSHKQRLQVMSRDMGGEEGGDTSALPSYERILAPLAHPEMKALAETHGLSIDDVRDWSTLRLVLNSFGWLARRVGDSTVPESSIVLAVLQVGSGAPGANALGLVGERGLVPIRASHLESVWGRSWRHRLPLVERVRMAADLNDFDKLLKGIDEREEELHRASSTGMV